MTESELSIWFIVLLPCSIEIGLALALLGTFSTQLWHYAANAMQ